MNASATLKDRLGLAEAASTPDEKMRPMTPLELEWKQRIYQKLLRVLDLSLISSIEEQQARAQIREITLKLITDELAPLSLT